MDKLDKLEFLEECRLAIEELSADAENAAYDAEKFKPHDAKLSTLFANLARDQSYIATYLADKLEESGANVKG